MDLTLQQIKETAEYLRYEHKNLEVNEITYDAMTYFVEGSLFWVRNLLHLTELTPVHVLVGLSKIWSIYELPPMPLVKDQIKNAANVKGCIKPGKSDFDVRAETN